MKKSIFLKFFLLFYVSFILTSGIPIQASEKYYTNSSENLDDLFSVSNEDIKEPFQWITERKTYIVVKEENNRVSYFFNTPNIQQLLYNQATNVIPTGYVGSGIHPYKKDGVLNFVEIPKKEDAKTGLQRYGFSIPNLSYIGEQPKVYISLMGVLVEENPINFVVNKIKGIFGGSYIKAPDKSDMKTLAYLSPNDYGLNDNTFERWISSYWDSTIEGMADGQILISNADPNTGSRSYENQEYVKETVINQTGLAKEMPAKERNEMLKELLGRDYSDVITNIIAVGIKNGDAKGFDRSPQRIMPYDRDTLIDSDKATLAISDPRSEKQNALSLFGLELKIGLSNFVTNSFSNGIIMVAGKLSELTVFINSITNFSTIEKLGIDPMLLWKSPLLNLFVNIIGVLLVFFLLKQVFLLAKGENGLFVTVTRAIGSFILVGFLLFVNTNPNVIYNSAKNVSNYFFNMGSLSLSLTDTANELMAAGDNSEKVDTAYWIPYYSIWAKYNTGVAISEDAIDKDDVVNEPEQVGMKIPEIGGKEVRLWSANIAEALTSGPMVDNDIYRSVDHYMAPRITYNGPDSHPILRAEQNENYNGGIQKGPDFGLFFLVLVILIAVLLKLLLFIEFLFELTMLPVNLALTSIEPRDLKWEFKRLLASVARVGLWDLAISLLIYTTLLTSGLLAFAMSIFASVAAYGGIKSLLNSNSIFRPRILSSIQDFSSNYF